MTRLQKPVFPLMSRVGTPRSPSVGALFLLWLQMRCGWNFLGLQKPTRVNVTTLTSLTLHFHGTLHCTFHLHSTPLLLSMAAGLWRDGQKPHQKIIWEMSVKKVLMLQPLIHWCYISGFWAGKLRSNTFIILWLSWCSEQDFCSDHVIKGFLILAGNNSNRFHLQTSMDQPSCRIYHIQS